jgi:hypothetical protein
MIQNATGIRFAAGTGELASLLLLGDASVSDSDAK